MAETFSTMVELGTPVPDFFLPEVNIGEKVGPHDLVGAKAFVIMFISKHCPYVQHILAQVTDLSNEYLAKGIRFAAISSNDVTQYPDDHPDQIGKMASTFGWKFPVLYDVDQTAARDFQATCTPDFFVYNKQAKLIYRGQLDESRPGNDHACDGQSLRSALDAVIAGKRPSPAQSPSMGCNIKWK